MSNIIVIAFSPWNIVGCLLKKGLQRGGHGHPRTPLVTPLVVMICLLLRLLKSFISKCTFQSPQNLNFCFYYNNIHTKIY